MELHQALKHIIKAEGQDIVTDLRLVNILNDLNAYQDIQGSKYMVRAIIDDGFALRFKQVGALNASANDLIRTFYSTTGFNADSVTKIFHSFAFGLGWINSMPTAVPAPSAPSPAPQPAPSRPKPSRSNANGSQLNLTESQLDNKSEKFKHQYAHDAESYLDRIITICGEPEKDLGVRLSANVSFDADLNTFNINLEFVGGIAKQREWLYFDVVMKSVAGKIMAKQQVILDPKAGKRKYFVEQVYMAQEDFRRVCDIAEILIYWKED